MSFARQIKFYVYVLIAVILAFSAFVGGFSFWLEWERDRGLESINYHLLNSELLGEIQTELLRLKLETGGQVAAKDGAHRPFADSTKSVILKRKINGILHLISTRLEKVISIQSPHAGAMTAPTMARVKNQFTDFKVIVSRITSAGGFKFQSDADRVDVFYNSLEQLNRLHLILYRNKAAELSESDQEGDSIYAFITLTVLCVGALAVYRLTKQIDRVITDHKQMEGKMQESETQLQQVFDSIPHTVILKDKEGRYLQVNQAACEFWRTTAEQIIGKTAQELSTRSKEEIESIVNSDEAVLSGGQEIRWFQQTLVDHEGNPRSFQTSKTAISNLRGEVTGLVSVGLDVTERDRAEENLRASRRLLETVFDSIPVGVFVKNADSVTIMANKAHAASLGRPLMDFENKTVEEINVGTREEMARMNEIDRQVLGAGGRIEIPEDTLTSTDGEITWWHVVKTPLMDDDGNIIGLVGVRENITERKKIDVMKQEFISVVSHELRTPLTSIIGSVGLILGGVAGGLSEKAEGMLKIANSNAQRLLYLINDMLDLEKIESGRMGLVMEQVDAARLAEEAVRDNMPYAEKYNVSFVVKSPPRETTVWGSREGLMQVFANLLSNAAKFSPAGGVVELSVDVLESSVRLTVADQGRGIPLEAQQSIFEKFTQVDSSDTRGKDGTGLGLSIARAIIRQHGGEMNLESEPGKGSRFYFDLPFRSNPDIAADPLRPGNFGGEPPSPA